jgi:hypothetical protein
MMFPPGKGGKGGIGALGASNGDNGNNGARAPTRMPHLSIASLLGPFPTTINNPFRTPIESDAVLSVRLSEMSPAQTPGAGGDGALVMIAPRGVFLSGTVALGTFGSGWVYGAFHNHGRFIGALPKRASYSQTLSIPAHEFFLVGGGGGGGAGGDGQLPVPYPRAQAFDR